LEKAGKGGLTTILTYEKAICYRDKAGGGLLTKGSFVAAFGGKYVTRRTCKRQKGSEFGERGNGDPYFKLWGGTGVGALYP